MNNLVSNFNIQLRRWSNLNQYSDWIGNSHVSNNRLVEYTNPFFFIKVSIWKFLLMDFTCKYQYQNDTKQTFYHKKKKRKPFFSIQLAFIEKKLYMFTILSNIWIYSTEFSCSYQSVSFVSHQSIEHSIMFDYHLQKVQILFRVNQIKWCRVLVASLLFVIVNGSLNNI